MQNKYTSNIIEIISKTKVPDNFAASSVSKISLKSNNSFSIPAGPKLSCPGATTACNSCYAMKFRHHFPAVQKKFARNWVLLKKYEQENDTRGATNALLKMIPEGAKIFRIHESGDFHSQWVVNIWSGVIKQRPDVYFWAYTRSFDLSFSSLTRYPNFALWASTDTHNNKEAKKFVRRFRKSGTKHAFGPWVHKKPIPNNSVVCPVTNGKLKINGACDKCKLCIVKKRISRNIVFLAH